MNTFNYPSEDFSSWMKLAKEDPAAFESQREIMLQDAIDSAPEEKQVRLRRLQWRIDQARNHAKNPMSACLNIYSMMWDSVLGPKGLVDHIQLLTDNAVTPGQSVSNAKVLPFRPSKPS